MKINKKFTEAPSKKSSSPASSFDNFLESLKVSIDPACIFDTNADNLLEFRKASGENEKDAVYFHLIFLVFPI